jgi:hypothetical protein
MNTAAEANKPEDKPVEVGIEQEFITRLANDPWVEPSVKQAAQAALRRYEPKPEPAKAEEHAASKQ